MQILSAIKRLSPDLMLMMGDNVYGALEASGMQSLARAYGRQRKNFEAIGWEIPTEAIWDDGDFGINDGGADHQLKEEAKRLFLEFWKVDQSDRRANSRGLFHEKLLKTNNGLVQILFLDTRYFKSPWLRNDANDPIKRYLPDKAAKTMLGEEQWKWLAQSLLKPAKIRILISPIQMLASGHFWECWAMFPNERLRLMKLLDFLNIRNLIILSGDRHRAAFYRDETPGGIELLECTSSSLNAPASDRYEPGPKRLTELYVKQNFGFLTIDWPRKLIVIEIRDLNGKVVQKQELRNIL